MKNIFILFIVIFSLGCIDSGGVGSDALFVGDINLTLSELEASCNLSDVAEDKGIPLDCIVLSSGVVDPENHTYTLLGSDGYQKTVKWDDMQKGILTPTRSIAFSHLSKGFWVKDVVGVQVS